MDKKQKLIKKIIGVYKYLDNNYKLANAYLNESLALMGEILFTEKCNIKTLDKKIVESNFHKKGVASLYLSKIDMATALEHKGFLEEFYRLIQWYYLDVMKEEIPKEIAQNDAKFLEKNPQEIEFTNYNQLLSEGWIIKDVVIEAVDIALETIEGLTEELTGGIDTWVELRKETTECFGALRYRDRLIAQWSFVVVSSSDYKKILKGKFDEDEIEPIKLKEKGKYKIYIDTVAVLPQYRSARTLGKIMDGFFNQMIELAKKGILFTDWSANAYTSEGVSMCKMLDMKYMCDHYEEGKVYSREFYPIDKDNSWNKKYPEIIKLYS